ncbi:MAG TPA: HDOD domain-containing protein [Dissulfurispiraceae bacterium]|nr:HDOD domain-containing protein [Dissulfurispiraceae bacterium]
MDDSLFDISLILPGQEEVNAVLARSVTELPILPLVVLKLLRITSDENSSLDDLERLVETEPTVLTKMLRIVNSAAFGLNHRVSNVRQAIQHIGFRAIRTLALEVTLFEQLVAPSRLYQFDRIHYWQHCLSVACLSKSIAQEVGHPDPDEVYVAGLLHDIGKIMLDVYGRISYSEFLGNLPPANGLLVDEEKQIVGVSHDELGAYFCAEWGLPTNLLLAIRLHHGRFSHLRISRDQGLLVAIVALSNLVAWTQGIGSVNILRHPILQPEVSDYIDFDQISLQSLLARMDVEIKSIAEFYNFSFPSAEIFRENLLRATINLSKKNTEYHYQQEELQKQVETLVTLKRSVAAPHQSLERSEIIRATLEAIQKEFSYDRLYVFQVDDRRRCLVISDAIGADGAETALVGLEIGITPGSEMLLNCLRMKSPMVVYGTSVADRAMIGQLGVQQLGLIPITSDQQVLGLIGADNVSSDRPIEIAELTTVAVVANELGMALERSRLFEKYRVKAAFDDLTELHNRGALNDILEESFQKALSGEAGLSVAMVDIDYFKRFNDSFGHLAGDNVLKVLASALRRLSRPTDILGRFGGEEFLVLLPGTSFEHAMLYAERLRREIEKLGKLLLKRYRGQPLTISVGIATFEQGLTTKEALIAKADEALYSAKGLGRNRVVGIFGPVRKFLP